MIPPPEAINHIPVVTTSARQGPDTERHSHTSGNQPPTSLMPGNSERTATISTPSFGAGLPPVPQKLVERIQEGKFIDMAELTIDRLSMSPFNDTSKPSHSKRWLVTSIIEWTQCFTNYIAILIQAHPERTSDLLGYQHLILQAHLEYLGDGWLVYDRRFRQIAATQPGTLWARRDGDLWNMVFSSSQRKPYCQHCFGSTHSSERCSGALDTPINEKKTLTQKPKICKDWNYWQCTFPGCRFVHACLNCYKDPSSRDCNHKVLFCPKNPSQWQEASPRPLMRIPSH